MFYVYVLFFLKDKGFYIGFSAKLILRIRDHFSGKVTATKNRLPLRLIYYEAFCNKKDAKKRERFLKSGSGHKFLKKQLVSSLKELK